MLTGGVTEYPGQELLGIWCMDFLTNHSIPSNTVIILTQEEKDNWFDALDAFILFNTNEPGLYGTPSDGTLPTALLNLWSSSICEY